MSKADFTNECLGSMPKEVQSQGVEPFRAAYCQVCLNLQCTFAKGFSSKWEERMDRQLEGLLRPIFADIKDPQFQHIHEMPFLSLDHDPEDWSVQGTPLKISDSEEVRISPKALQNAILLKGMGSSPDLTPARVDVPAPVPAPVQAPAHARADAPAHVSAPTHADTHAPVQTQAPAREVFGPQVNTTPPAGGFMIQPPQGQQTLPKEGRKEIIITDEHDPWAVKTPSPTGSASQRVRKVVRASDGQVVKK